MLRKMKVPQDGVLLIHSSFKRFNQDGYKVERVLDAILNYMRQGTVLFPTMSWRYVKANNPFFHELNTPSNTGILTEYFRINFATHRSLHPTHSIAGLGNQAGYILSEHHLCSTPCGKMSPFARLVELDAYIIMLGVGIDCCTLIHHAEELIAPEFYVKPEPESEKYYCHNKRGEIVTVQLRRHLFLPRNYWQFQDTLASQEQLTVYQFDNSICLGFRAKTLFNIVTQALKKNPKAIIAPPGQRYRMM